MPRPPRKSKNVKKTPLSRQARKVKAVPGAGNKGPSAWVSYQLLGALALILAGLFSLPNYHVLLSPGGFLDRILVHPSLLFLGLAGLAYLFRNFPRSSGGPEIPLGQVVFFFALFSILCFCSRFYRPEEEPPYFFVDQLMVTGDIRSAMDFNEYSLIFHYGSPQPFARYLEVILWSLFPGASGTWVNRLTSALIDVGVLWSLYFLGSGVKNRLVGLFMMAFWALSMFGITWAISGYAASSVILACALALLSTYKLVEKPTFLRFILWGATLAFGDYTYAPFRPWTPALITLVLGWALFSGKEKPKGPAPWLLAAGFWSAWVLVFLHTNKFFNQNPLEELIAKSWFPTAAAAGLLALFAWAWSQREKGEAERRVVGWAVGVGVTGLLMAPLMFDPHYSDYMFNRSIFRIGNDIAGGNVLQAIWDNGVYAFRIFFLTSEPDFSRYPIPGHSFFEVFPQVALLVGGVYFAVRPSWRKGFLLLMVLVGIAPFIFCQRPHTGRLFGAVAPMFLMGAWGMGACWEFFSREVKGSALRMALFLLLAVFWAWDGKTSFALFQGWTDYRTTNDAVIGRQLAQDWEKYRVIVAPHDHDFFQPQFAMLCDQRDVWSLNVPHEIDLGEGERGKDIALYIYGGDPATLEKARKDFPEARWVDVPSLNGPGFMKKVMIPFSSLEEKPGKMIFVKRVPESYWRRRFYWADYPYGLARGIVGWDDRVADLSAPFPAGMREGVTARVDGEMTATTAGDYSFSVPWWGENIELAIDGKKVHFTRRNDLGRATLYLGSGLHRVSWATTFKKSLASFQEITVTPPNGGREWVLGRSQ